LSEAAKTAGEVMAGAGKLVDDVERYLRQTYNAYLIRIGPMSWTEDTIQVGIKFDRDRLPL
jgi:hypothetical protein